jgi:hypothetical protein
VRAIAAFIAAFALAAPAQAADNKVSPQQFDLACAVVVGANMGNDVSKTGDASLITLLAFYLGRLSARDDTKEWNKIALGRVAELQERALDDSLLKSCINFYIAKTQ